MSVREEGLGKRVWEVPALGAKYKSVQFFQMRKYAVCLEKAHTMSIMIGTPGKSQNYIK